MAEQSSLDETDRTTTAADGQPRKRSQGAELRDDGVHYRTWCKHDRAAVMIVDAAGDTLRTIALESDGNGYFSGADVAGAAGDLYLYRFGDSQGWPDPASRFQPAGVHGPSEVIDASTYSWTDETWTAPAFSDLIIYELHVGTFTGEGTFRSAVDRLEHLVALGVTAVELMPLGDFPGDRNWGYDGVMPYAPTRAYGTPDDLRALVDAAHALGLAVLLDVVYNHLGPDGNYTGVYHDIYQSDAVQTPWGAGLNYAAAPVRAFFVENAPYWMREFHIDGFRLDATHEIADTSPRHILAEIAAAVHSLGGFVIAEDDRNHPQLLKPISRHGMGFDGVWADDFHHVVRVMLTGNREGYYANYEGTSAELAQTLTHGWLYRGQAQRTSGKPRGGDPAELMPQQFVFCTSNHDQVGNRALGERLSHVVSAAAYRAASALICLVPQTPLLFMGQEWAASTPFQFFTDHNAELGPLVTEGRRKEFQHFPAFRDPAVRNAIPDPQAVSTFTHSKLHWEELHDPHHAGVLLLYREFLELRQTHPAFRERSRDTLQVAQLNDGIVAMLFGTPGEYSCAV
ncbi:MAG: malto-oligosyltrehalose trehalohydrolase, partial [Verrucomicrobiota bacterium]|nr:malto-oligosyltrehalose trehalohydrolase [Verrucomicrobiota bacterium]